MKKTEAVIMFSTLSSLLILLLLLPGLPAQSKAQTWNLVWGDEFDGPAGSGLDSSKWTAEVGGGGWGNEELEYYTDSTRNASVNEGGHLVITAIKEKLKRKYKCWYGRCKYSSARLVTKNKFDQKYGRIEARIKIPFGQGIWPAFWMLGNDIDTVGWPSCGEIDIMENIGREPTVVHGTIHGPGYSGGNGIGAAYSYENGRRLADDFHLFAVEWEPDEIRWYFDDSLYAKRTTADLPKGARWVFDHPFFIILNLAVGGTWPGKPNSTTEFPQEMKVDYVRVYQRP